MAAAVDDAETGQRLETRLGQGKVAAGRRIGVHGSIDVIQVMVATPALRGAP